MAVYTDVTDEELEAFLKRYDLGELIACKGIAEGVENSNFLIETEKGPFILTLYEKRVQRADLPFFLSLMEHLSKAGIECPLPLHDRQDHALQELAGRPAAIFTFLRGLSVRRPKVAHCAAVGHALAGLHIAGSNFSMMRENALSVSGWRALFEALAGEADRIAPGFSSELEHELACLEKTWPDTLPSGIIHADLFPDNVFFLEGKLSGIIDFYFACRDAFAYDLAICLNAWCFETDCSFNITKGKALLDGYRAVRPLSKAEIEAFPLLARGAAFRFLLTRAYDWLNTPQNALVRPKDPLEYRRKLRFHQAARSAQDYGFQP